MLERDRDPVQMRSAWARRSPWYRGLAAASPIAILTLISGCETLVVTEGDGYRVVSDGSTYLASRSTWDGNRITGQLQNKGRERVG
jgi:hypothetical protein